MTTQPNRTATLLAAIAIAIVLPFALVACGDDDDTASTTTAKAAQPTVSDAWAGPATAGGNGAIYMTITGDGDADALVGAAVPADIAATVELHETTTADDTDTTTTTMAGSDDTTTTAMGGDPMGGEMMTMRPVDKIDIPADGDATLEPGGYHIMLLDLQKDLVVGDKIPVTLTFEHAGEIQTTAEVRER